MFNKGFIKFLLLICFSIASVLFLFKILPERFPDIKLDQSDIPSAIVSIIILLSILFNFLNSYGLKSLITQILIWQGVFLVIITGYAFRPELLQVSERVLAVLIPSHKWINDKGDIVIARSNDGHFYTNVLINGVSIRFMIDTGASDLALTKKAARALNFNLSNLKYTITYSTANGTNTAAPVLLKTVQIGPKIFKEVKGHIGSGELDVSLLGMSLIERFKSFKIDNDLLTLSY